MIKGAAVGIFCVDQQVQDNRRAAEVGHTLIDDCPIDALGRDITTADDRAAHGGHHPRMTPIVAVKHRHNCQVNRVKDHAPTDWRAHGDQICAPVVVNHAFGSPRGAGRVVERDAFPFILRHHPWRIRVTLSQQILIGGVAACGRVTGICIGHFDDDRGRAVHCGDCGLHQRQKLCVGQHQRRFSVVEDVGHSAGIKADVDGIQDRARRRHAEMRLRMGVGVGQNGCDNITGRDASRGQCGRKPGDAGMVLRVGLAVRAVNDGLPVREHPGRTCQMAQGGERHKIGRSLLQSSFILHPAHVRILPKQTQAELLPYGGAEREASVAD